MKNNPFIRWFEYPDVALRILEEPTMSIITPQILTQFAPTLSNNAEQLATILNDSNINTKLRLAHFLAQAGHESALFSLTTENLNYSADGLGRVFKKYFPTTALQQQYARKPEQIANRVYANRMGNGNEASGDGWKFRGRGYFQLTGRDNYTEYSKFAYKDNRIVNNPELLAQPIDALKSAIWYWNTNNLNRWADKDDILTLSKVINLGNPVTTATPNGMDDRIKQLTKAKRLLGI